MGRALPASARYKRSWWTNRHRPTNPQTVAWLSAGYLLKTVDMAEEIATFQTLQSAYQVQRKNGEIHWNSAAIKALRLYKGLSQAQFGDEIGVRRETVSEWEPNKYEPDRSKPKLLSIIAKQANFAEPAEDL